MSDSILGDLSTARVKLIDSQKLPLEVPGWGQDGTPRFFIVYKPAKLEDQRRVLTRIEKAKGSKVSEEALEANADVLVKNTIHVEAEVEGERHVIGEPANASGAYDWAIVAEALQLDEKRAIATCRALFLKEGDLMGHAAKLSKWSGLRIEDTEEDFQGE